MDNFYKALWIWITSQCALLGMAFSIISLNLLHAIIIGYKIFFVWVINLSIMLYLAIRDYIRIFKKNDSKRR